MCLQINKVVDKIKLQEENTDDFSTNYHGPTRTFNYFEYFRQAFSKNDTRERLGLCLPHI